MIFLKFFLKLSILHQSFFIKSKSVPCNAFDDLEQVKINIFINKRLKPIYKAWFVVSVNFSCLHVQGLIQVRVLNLQNWLVWFEFQEAKEQRVYFIRRCVDKSQIIKVSVLIVKRGCHVFYISDSFRALFFCKEVVEMTCKLGVKRISRHFNRLAVCQEEHAWLLFWPNFSETRIKQLRNLLIPPLYAFNVNKLHLNFRMVLRYCF